MDLMVCLGMFKVKIDLQKRGRALYKNRKTKVLEVVSNIHGRVESAGKHC